MSGPTARFPLRHISSIARRARALFSSRVMASVSVESWGLRNPDRFRIGKFADSGHAELAAEPGTLYATEWQTWIGGDHRVNEHHSGVQLGSEKFLFLAIFGPRARAEAESGIVR